MTEKTQPTDAELDMLIDEVAGLDSSDEVFREFARAALAKWATPPAGAGEPVAWLSVDCIGERYLCFTKPNDSDPARPLVFGDTTPQPTQAQAGAVTDAQVLAAVRVVSPGLFRHGLQPLPNDGANTAARMRKEADTVRKMLEAANGIKGGQS